MFGVGPQDIFLADTTITEMQVNNIINVIIAHIEDMDGITIPGLN